MALREITRRLQASGSGGGSTPLPPTFASIVGIGDSYVVGNDASDSAHQWFNIFSASKGVGSPLNKGVSGTVLQNSNDSGGSPRTNNFRDRFIADTMGSNKRDAVVCAGGFNDARYIGAPSTFNVAGFTRSYTEMINGWLGTGYTRDKIIVVAPYYISDTGLNTGSTGFQGQTRSGFEAFVTAARAVAHSFGVYYADPYAALLAAGPPATTDNIHYSDVGHAVIATAVGAATKFPTPAFADQFLYDTFTDSDGVLLSAHTPDTGIAWAAAAGASPTIQSNRLYSTAANATWNNQVAAPKSADYYVEAELEFLTAVSGQNVGVIGRRDPAADTYYFARFTRASNTWGLFKMIAGTPTQLGSNQADAWSSGLRTVRLTMTGTTISMAVGGVTLVSVTDSAITAPGCAGVRFGGAQASNTGIQVNHILASH